VKYAILGDIHGNWEALRAVLADARARAADTWASVGDIVGYNPDPNRCLDRIRELNCAAVCGNHDYFTVHPPRPDDLSVVAAAALDWTRERLSADDRAYLTGLPRTARADGVTLVHNTLESASGWPYVVDVADAARSLRRQETPVCFCGHTHVPIMYEQRNAVTLALYDTVTVRDGSLYLVNVGSVGQPRDRDPRACYVLYDSEARTIEFVRVPYDLTATQEGIGRAGLPLWLAMRLTFGV
jgi:diadenosine tetraphosphatase ApaH/serine/threonine PP2A family protein phosphatase